MSKTRETPPPLPDLNGFPTKERLAHMPEGMTHGIEHPRIGPSMVNAPVRPENAPEQARAGSLEHALDSHEEHVLMKFIAASLTVNGRAQISNYEGGSMPKGKRAGGKLPFNEDQQSLIGWYTQIMNTVPSRTKCGLELFYRIFLGESNGVTLDDIGRYMTRNDDKKIIKGGYITFYRMAVQDIEEAERKVLHVNTMKKIRRRI